MARLRFPGRPGYRFDRHGIKYGADDVKNTKDPSLAIVAYIHQGLHQFRELFGESDEEDEFEGFFHRDYKKNERKLAAILAAQNAAEQSGIVGTRFAKAKDSIEALPASERTRGRMRIVIRQSYKQLITSGLAKPAKSHIVSSIKEVEQMKSGTRPPEKRKIIRIKITPKKLHVFPPPEKRKIGRPSLSLPVTENLNPVKKRGRPRKYPLPETITNKFRDVQKQEKADKKVVKQLILKAKCHGKLVKTKVHKAKLPKPVIIKTVKAQISPSKTFSPQGSKLPMHAKKFVLPVMSSRSSRIIIPNKRFIQDDGFSSALLGKTKSSSFSSPSESKKVKLSSPKISNSETSFSQLVKSKLKKNSVSAAESPARVISTQHVMTSDSKKKGQKHIVKITTKKVETSGTESGITVSDDEESKPSLFPPRSPLAPSKLEVFNRAGPMSLPGYNRQRLDSAAHKSRDFLRKAKLQLNRTTLNRSKAALARSLKAKMKREAKVEEQRERMRQFSPSSPTSPLRLSPISTARSLTDLQLSPSRIFDSAQALSPEQTFGQGGSLKISTTCSSKVSKQLAFESKCAICGDPNLVARNGLYYGVPSCYSCSQFYRKEVGYGMRFACVKSGNCEVLKNNKRKCLACWFRKCERFYPSADKMKSSPEKNRKVLPDSKMTPLALDLSDHDNHQLPPFSPSSLTFGVSTPARSPGSGFSPKYVSTASGPGASSSSVSMSPGVATASANVSPSFMPSPDSTPDKSPSKTQRGDFRGPRIKHVCRRAAMVLKKPVAKFPSPPSLRLSALPSLEKEKIFRADRDARANESSDDDRPMEDIIRSAKSDDVVIIHRRPKKTTKCLVHTGKYHQIGKRKLRCRTCDGCKKPECGKCIYCRDKTKNGGPNLIKQACIDRKCLKPIYKKAATNSFVMKNLKASETAIVDDNQNVPVPKNLEGNPSSSNTSQIASYLGGREARQGEVTECLGQTGDGVLFDQLKQSSLEMPKRGQRLREKAVSSVQQAIVQPVLNTTMKVVPTPGLLKDMHRIKADLKEDNSLNFSWAYGMALTMMKPTCVRTVCFLCGSAGKHELIFCMACCEPFHLFCLSEDERPDEENMENWCCRRCQFCNVCGHQKNLLQCDRCQSTYHPECLGPNYPTKPSRQKNIWVCMKCVRCKSCGATTPGNGNSAIWMYDFSLCYECGQLMDKGNFCPICHKCYSDDDWESKMIECAMCKSWVHAKCEELSDEMYQVLSDLPEDVHYTCKLCSTERPAHWEVMLNEAFYGGIKSVLLGLLNMKCSHHLINIDQNKEKKLHENKKKLSPKSKTSENIHKQSSRSKSATDHSSPDTSPSDHNKTLPSVSHNRTVMETDNHSDDSKNPNQSDSNCKEPRNIFNTIAMETGISPLDVSFDVSGATGKKETLVETALICDKDIESDLIKSKTESTKESLSVDEFTVKTTNQMCSDINVANKNVPDSELTNENVDFDSKHSRDIHLTYEKNPNTNLANEHCSMALTNENSLDAGLTNEKCSVIEAANEKDISCNAKKDDYPLSPNTSKPEPSNESSFSDVDMLDTSMTQEVMENDFVSTCDLIPPIFRSGGTPDSQISMKVRYDPTETITDVFDDSPEKCLIEEFDAVAKTTSDNNSISSGGKIDTSEIVKENVATTAKESVCLVSSDDILSGDIKSNLDPEAVTEIDSNTNERKLDPDSKMEVCKENPKTESKSEIGDLSEQVIKVEEKEKNDSLIKDDSTDSRMDVSEELKAESEVLRADSESLKTESEEVKTESTSVENISQSEQNEPNSNHLPSSSTIVTYSNSIFSLEKQKTEPLIDLVEEKQDATLVPVDGGVSDSTETLSHPSEAISSPEGSLILNKKPSVHFLDPKSMDYLNKRLAKREFPKDFAGVKQKLESNSYKTVEEFSEDMVNIIQAALNSDDTVTRKKMNNSVRSTFIKQMEKAFPWFNVNTCMLWEHNRNLPDGMLPDAVLPPTSDHTYSQWLERDEPPISPQPSPFKRCPTNPTNRVIVPMEGPLPASFDEDGPVINAAEIVSYSAESDYEGEDTRRCVLCSKLGDDFPDDSGRLLYVGQNDWAHVNCALWSAEVFEERDGCLQNVHSAITRGKKLLCDLCGKSGATVGCCSRACSGNYHFACARLDHCVFQEDKKVYCRPHGDQAVGEMLHHGGFPVLRRVCVDMECRYSKKSWNKGINPNVLSILIGSCTIESLGHLEPLSDRSNLLLPVDFICSRVYWSTKDARRRCIYTCRITEVRPTVTTPEVKIKDMTIIHDETHPDFVPLQTLDLKSLGLSSLMNSPTAGGEKQLDVIFVSQTWSSVSGTTTSTSMISMCSSTATTSTTSMRSTTLQTPTISQQSAVKASITDVSSISEPMKVDGENLKNPPTDGFNLNILSPNTLKCLGSAALSKYTSHQKQTSCDPDFGNLTRMVDRLNNAASRVAGKHPSSAGLVGGKRPASAERTFREMSPPVGKLKRSSSCDSPSPWFKPEILNPSRSFTPSFNLKNVDLSASKMDATPKAIEIDECNVPSSTAVTEALRGSSVNGSGTDVVEITEEQALVEKVLSSIPSELLEQCDGQTVVVMAEDADLTEEEMIELAQQALEADANPAHDQSDLGTKKEDLPLDDGKKVEENTSQPLAESEAVAKDVPVNINHPLTEGQEVAGYYPECINRPLDEGGNVVTEVSANKNSLAERETVAKEVPSNSNQLAEGEKVAVPPKANVPKIVEEILSKDLGTWLSRTKSGESLQESAQLLREDALCGTSIVQKGGGNENLLKRHEMYSNINAPETKRKRIVHDKDLVQNKKSHSVKDSFCMKDQDVKSGNENIPKLQNLDSLVHIEDPVNKVKSNVGSNIGNKSLRKVYLSSSKSPSDMTTPVKEINESDPSGSKDSSDVKSCLKIQSNEKVTVQVTKPTESSDLVSRSPNQALQMSDSERERNTKSCGTSPDYSQTRDVNKSLACKYQTVQQPVYAKGRMIGYHVIQKKVDSKTQETVEIGKASASSGGAAVAEQPGKVIPAKMAKQSEDKMIEADGTLVSKEMSEKMCDTVVVRTKEQQKVRVAKGTPEQKQETSSSDMEKLTKPLSAEENVMVSAVGENRNESSSAVHAKCESKEATDVEIQSKLAREITATVEHAEEDAAKCEAPKHLEKHSASKVEETISDKESSSREATGKKESALRDFTLDKESSPRKAIDEKESGLREVTLDKECSSREATVEKESSSREATVKKECSSREATVEKESSSRETTVEKESSSREATVKKECSSREATVEKESSSREATVEKESSSRDITEETDSSRELTVDKAKPDKQNLSNCVENTEETSRPKENTETVDRALSCNGNNKDVGGKKEKSKKEPLKKYPLRRTIQRVIGDIDMMAEITNLGKNHEKSPSQQKSEFSTVKGGEAGTLSKEENKDGTDRKTLVQDKERGSFRRTRSRSGNIHSSLHHSDAKSQSKEDNSEKSKDKESDNKLLDQPCLRIEKLSDTDKNVVGDHDWQIEKESRRINLRSEKPGLKGDSEYEVLIEKESKRLSLRIEKLPSTDVKSNPELERPVDKETGKVNSRRLSVRLEKLSDADFPSSSEQELPSEKESTGRISSRRASLRSETPKNESDDKIGPAKEGQDGALDDMISDVQIGPVKEGHSAALHEKIAEKIKAESIAKSSPGEKGPIKCRICRRMYRTEESYKIHIQDCNFEVSTSDEEEEDLSEDKLGRRSSRNSTEELGECYVKLDSIKEKEESEKIEESDDKLKSPDCATDKEDVCKQTDELKNKNPQQTTKELPAVSLENPVKRGRGRPPKKKILESTSDSLSPKICEQDSAISTTPRGRFGKKVEENESRCLTPKVAAEFSESKTPNENISVPDVESVGLVSPTVVKKRGRPRKYPLPSEQIPSTEVTVSSDSLSESVSERLRGSTSHVQGSQDDASLDKKEQPKTRSGNSVSKSQDGSQKVGGASDDEKDAAFHTKKWVKIRKTKLRKCSVMNWNFETCDKIQSICPKDSVDTSSGKKRHRKRRKKGTRIPVDNDESSTENRSEEIILVHLETSPSNSEQEADNETSEINSRKTNESRKSSTSLDVNDISQTKESTPNDKSGSLDGNSNDGDCEKMEKMRASTKASSRRKSIGSPSKICQGLKEKLGRKTPEILADVSSRRASMEKQELDDLCSLDAASNPESLPSPKSPDGPFLDELTGEMMYWINGKVVSSKDFSKQDNTEVSEKTELQRISPGSLGSVRPRNIFEALSGATPECESKKSLAFGSEVQAKSSLPVGSVVKDQNQKRETAGVVTAEKAIPVGVDIAKGSDKLISTISSEQHEPTISTGVVGKDHLSEVTMTNSQSFCSISSQSPAALAAKPLIPSPLTISKEPYHGFIPKPLAIRRPVVSELPSASPRCPVTKKLTVRNTPSKPRLTEPKIVTETGQVTQHVDVETNQVVVFPSQATSSKITEQMQTQDDVKCNVNQQSIKIATEILRQKFLEKQKHQNLANHLLNKMATNPSLVPTALLNQCGIQSGQGAEAAIQQNKASIIETALRQLQQINPGLVNTAAQQLGYSSLPQVNQLNIPSLQMPCVPNNQSNVSSLQMVGVNSQSNVASLQIPGVNSQSNISSLQLAGVNSQSNISSLQLAGVNNQSNVSSLQLAGVNSQSNVSSLHMSGVQTLQMSNVPMETSSTVSSLRLAGQYSTIHPALPRANLQNHGILVPQNLGQVNSTDIVYQPQLQTDTGMLQTFTSAFQQIPNTIPTPNIIQPIPNILQTQQVGTLHAASLMQTAPLLQCTPNILQQTASIVQQTNQAVLGHQEMLQTQVPLQTPGAFSLSSSNVSYMGSFVLPKVEQRQLGNGEMDQCMLASRMTNNISENIMNCLPSPMMQHSGVATSVQNIGMTSAGRPVIKVMLENQDGSDSRIPLPVQDLVKNIASSRSLEPTTSVKVVCKTTKSSAGSEQTIYSNLPASSLIQSISRKSGSVNKVSSERTPSSSSSSSCRSPPRVLQCSLTPSSPNLRKILNKITVTTPPTMTTSSPGIAQKAVMSRINVLKKMLNKPNILHRKRQGNPIEGMPAHKRQMTGDGTNMPTPVRYIIKRSLHPDKAGDASSTVQYHRVTEQPETPLQIHGTIRHKVNEQTGHIEKRKIIQKFSIPGFLEDLLLKQKGGNLGVGHGISKPDINRALLDLTKSSIPSSPSSTSSSQGIVRVLQKKVTGKVYGSSKSEKVKRTPKKVQTLLDKSKSCAKKASDYTKLKLGKKGKTNRRKSPLKVRNVTQSLAVGHISHPLIHHQNEATSLPQPAIEEEVRATPLTAYKENQNPLKKEMSKDAPRLVFEITSDDGFYCKADTMEEAWKKVLNKTQDSRSAARMKSLSYNGIKGHSMFGIDHQSVVYLLEQLYGASHCHNYRFKYHRHTRVARAEEPPLNDSGCIRTEPFSTRKEFDMFSFLMSQYRQRPKFDTKQDQTEMTHKSARRTTSLELPMAMRFRKLQEHAKEAVGAYRSNIHGRGLFCKRNIDAGEMVIEYAGEVIRATLTDKREKYYESKGIGCYMFRIDDYDVVDATMHGSAARFINHSCEPNCYSKVINVDGRKHIVIFAMRQILRGEELTYDYKFPIEEVKIPCTCKSLRCRRYLN